MFEIEKWVQKGRDQRKEDLEEQAIQGERKDLEGTARKADFDKALTYMEPYIKKIDALAKQASGVGINFEGPTQSVWEFGKYDTPSLYEAFDIHPLFQRVVEHPGFDCAPNYTSYCTLFISWELRGSELLHGINSYYIGITKTNKGILIHIHNRIEDPLYDINLFTNYCSDLEEEFGEWIADIVRTRGL